MAQATAHFIALSEGYPSSGSVAPSSDAISEIRYSSMNEANEPELQSSNTSIQEMSEATTPTGSTTIDLTQESDIDSLFLQDLDTIAHEGRTIDPFNFRTPSPTPDTSYSNPIPNTRAKHQVVHRPIRITEKEVVLLKRIQTFVEDVEKLQHDLKTSKAPVQGKFKKLMNGLERHVQQHLKNGVPRVASGKAIASRKADGEKGNVENGAA